MILWTITPFVDLSQWSIINVWAYWWEWGQPVFESETTIACKVIRRVGYSILETSVKPTWFHLITHMALVKSFNFSELSFLICKMGKMPTS